MRPLMSLLLPAPSMIVVLSLSTITFLARPRSASVRFSSLMPKLSNTGGAAGQDGDIFQHRLAAIAVARCLDRTHLERAAEPVDDQGRQGLAFDFLGHDQQRLAGVDHLLQAPGRVP